MNNDLQWTRRGTWRCAWRWLMVAGALAIASPTLAYEMTEYDAWIQAFVRNRTGIFLNGGRNCTPPGQASNVWQGIAGCPPNEGQNNVVDRFEQSVWIEGKKRFSKSLSATIKLRAFVDNVFDVQEGTSRWSGTRMAITNLSNTWSLAYDDFLREAFLDYTLDELPKDYGTFFVRAGKQQVVWGKADGFRLLDLINSQDYREPFYAVFEEVRIPNWMVRLDYGLPRNLLEDASVQVVFNPLYQSDTFPPAIVSPWSFRAFNTFQTAVNALKIPVVENLFDQPVDPAANFKNSEAGARWSHWIQNFGYTLNYYWDWTNLPHAKGVLTPDQQFVYKNTPDRVHKIGASFDYNIYELPLVGWKNFVLRAELLGSIGNALYARYLDQTFNAYYYRNTLDYVFGIDKYVYGIPFAMPDANTQTLLSAQLFQSFTPDARFVTPNSPFIGAVNNCLTNAGGACLNEVKTAVTFFAQNTSLASRLTSELLAYYSDAGEWWFRPRFFYDFSDRFRGEIGGNFFIGHTNDFVGEFARTGAQNVFVDLRYQFF